MGDGGTARRGPLLWVLAVVAAAIVLGTGFAVGTVIGADGSEDRVDAVDDAADADPGTSSTTASTDAPRETASTPPAMTDAPGSTSTTGPEGGALPPAVRVCDEVGTAHVPDFDPSVGDRAFCTDLWGAVVTWRSNGVGVTLLRADPSGWVVIVQVAVVAEVRDALDTAGAGRPHATALCGAVRDHADPAARC